MSALTLHLREVPPTRIDAGILTPDRLAGLDAEGVRRLPLVVGTERCAVGDLFMVTGADTGHVVIVDCHERLDYLGCGMRGGRLTVEGNTGHYLGDGMCGGRLEVCGDAGDFTARAASGGEICIRGNTGDFLGGAPVGERHGMRGGLVLVTGNAGDRAGDRMRRGVLLIEGNAGAYCASRMLAGTIGVLGNTGEGIGFGLRRGTVLLGREPACMPALFNDCGRHPLIVVRLMLAWYRGVSTAFGALAERTHEPVRRLAGDLSVDGCGEILIVDA